MDPIVERLEKYWKLTEEQLRLALAQLRSEETLMPFEQYQAEEYLAHNELQLAWEALLQVGEGTNIATAEFWRPMAKAAGFMLAADQESGYL